LLTFNRELLEKWGKHFKISSLRSQSNSQIVQKIMCIIFKLEPLEIWQERQAEIEKKKRQENKRKRQDDSEVLHYKRKRGPYICPPLSNIKKGITKEDLHNLYNLTDLQQWCKEQNIDHSGKKSLVIHRVFSYLETGELPIKKEPKKKKKRKRKSY